MYTVNEQDMLSSLIAYLESKNENELAAILKISSFEYDPQREFSGVISNQRKLYGKLHVPINHMAYVESKKELLSRISILIYTDNSQYRYYGIKEIGIKPIQTEILSYDDTNIVVEKNSVFTSFMEFLIANEYIDKIHRDYLFEACECGARNNLLSASVMLGASAELLLIQLSESYGNYIKKEREEQEYQAYTRKVLNAKSASIRLNQFLSRAQSNADFFKEYGFENIEINFSFFDVIRTIRNDSGHPTGKMVTKDEFRTLLANYQHFLPKVLDMIDTLNLFY